MAGGAPSRGSGNGIYGTLLEAGMGSAGTILATDLSETRRRGSNLGNLASGAGAIESWPARPEERLSRRRATGEATGSRLAEAEFCAGYGTAPVAHPHPPQIPAKVCPGP